MHKQTYNAIKIQKLVKLFNIVPKNKKINKDPILKLAS